MGRRKLFCEENLHVWGKILAGALICFFPLYGLDNMLPRFIGNYSILTPLTLIVSSLHKFLFMLILVSGVIFAFYKTSWRQRMMVLAPYGKMSLTNYIMQSVFGSMIFYNWGLGMYQYLGITASIATGFVLFVLQLAFCHWWMKSHRHGPMEYLWRKATWAGMKDA